MRLTIFLAPLALIACAAPAPEQASGKARFSGYPQALFDAFRDSCSGPARVFVAQDRNTFECRELMPPDVTASVLLAYDGTLEDLPRLVVRFRAEPDDTTYLVTNEVFVNVPQRQGDAVRILFSDRRMARELAQLYARAGGAPES